MITFSQYMEMRQAAMPGPHWLTQATAADLAFPGVADTKRAIERARKRGWAVTPFKLKMSISPESREAAIKGAMAVSRRSEAA